jgi:nitroimidazol reductase NimA-like FMN-containing flavoprotein (pyridoxamine 5'-phosphate oxidase superfamily)
MSNFDTLAAAARLLAANRYMTIASADAQGRPWVSPVWYAAASDTEFLWASSPHARHSRNIAARPEVAIVIFDSTVSEGDAEALYLEATAQQVVDDQLIEAISAYSARSQACGNRAWTVADVEQPSRFRLYRAMATAQSVLGPGDERLPVAHTPTL